MNDCNHEWVYISGLGEFLWFYCSKCGCKRTDRCGAYIIEELRTEHIRYVTKNG